MAKITWLGFQKEPKETISGGYKLITGLNLKNSAKRFSKKQSGRPIEVLFHNGQAGT